MHYLIAISYAIVLWWVSTGIIIILYRQARWTYDATFGGMSIVAAACAVALFLLRDNSATWAIYASFSAGTVVWGWNLASYYTGFITGQRVELPALPLTNRQRFVFAVKSTIYHELVSLLLLGGALWSIPGATNPTGFVTIVLFYVLHLLAKLNIYFGVHNFSGEWLPAHLSYITAFFGPARTHWFFVFTVSIATACTMWATSIAIQSAQPHLQIAGAFWALLSGAGLLELLVLMIPSAYLHRVLAFLTHLSVAANTKPR